MVDFLYRYQDSLLEAELTERMLFDVSGTDNLPVLSVPTLRRFVVTSILFILCVPFLLVLLTVPAFCQPRAPRLRTGFLWFAWHGCLL